MIRWCSYCHTFLGQVEPIADLAVTHGICDACIAGLHKEPEGQEEFFDQLRSLGSKLMGFARVPGGSDAELDDYLAQALGMGLKPAEILLSLVQPVLYSVGERFARGDISVAQEHSLSVFAAKVVERLRSQASLTPIPKEAPLDVLLVPVDGNSHILGLQVLEFLLASEGYRCLCITPGLPTAEIEALALHWRPSLLGVSLSLPSHLSVLETLAKWASVQAVPIKVAAGGFAYLDPDLKVPPGVQVVSPLLGTREILQALKAAGLQKNT